MSVRTAADWECHDRRSIDLSLSFSLSFVVVVVVVAMSFVGGVLFLYIVAATRVFVPILFAPQWAVIDVPPRVATACTRRCLCGVVSSIVPQPVARDFVMADFEHHPSP